MSCRGFDCRIDQHVDNGFLKACRNIFFLRLALLSVAAIEMMPYGGFDAAEAKIVGVFLNSCARKPNSLWVSFFGKIIDNAAAGISETHHLRDFVIRLTRRIVTRPAQMDVVSDIVDSVQKRVT